jgi:hypothetical protein
VGQKSTKEEFMKKKFFFILIVLFTFSLAFIGCDDPKENTPQGNEDPSGNETPSVTDSDLHNTWVSEEMTIKFKNDATFEVPKEVKGAYTASDKKITITPTDFDGEYLSEVLPEEVTALIEFENKWYSKTDIIKAFSDAHAKYLEELAELTEEEIEELEDVDFDGILAEMTALLNDMFGKRSGAYEISEDGKTLTLKGNLFGEEAEVTLTKKEA